MTSAPEPRAEAETPNVAAGRGALGTVGVPLARAGVSFRRGRGLMLAGLLGALGVGLAGLWQLLSHDDEARVYGELGRSINGIRQQYFDGFWECALSGLPARGLRSNTELIEWLRMLAQDSGAQDYAAHLREDCAQKLDPIGPRLGQLIAPPDLAQDVATLQRSAAQLQTHLAAWTACLDRSQPSCDDARELNGIARGWFEFQAAHASINKTLKLRLEKR
jgi:hypothetical protein